MTTKRADKPIYVDMRDFRLVPSSITGDRRATQSVLYDTQSGLADCTFWNHQLFHPQEPVETLCLLLQNAVGLLEQERAQLIDCLRKMIPVDLVSIFHYESVYGARYVVVLKPIDRLYDVDLSIPPFSSDHCGCRIPCPMPKSSEIDASACPSAALARRIHGVCPPNELHPLLRDLKTKYRVMALCEMLVERAIIEAVATHLPVEGVPERVAEYALCVFQRVGTVYE